MDNRRTYKVNIQGVEHDLLLTDQGAKRYGDRARLVEAVEEAETAVDEEEDEVVDEDTETETEDVETKQSTPRNKGRQPRNK